MSEVAWTHERLWHMLKGVLDEHLRDPEVVEHRADDPRISGYAHGLQTTLGAMAQMEELVLGTPICDDGADA